MNELIISKRVIGILILFLVSFLLPSFIFVEFHTSSLWPGVLTSSVVNIIILFTLFKQSFRMQRKDFAYFLLPFAVVFFDVVFVSKLEKKSVLSLFVWFFCFFSAIHIGKMLLKETCVNIFSAAFLML